MGDSYRFDINRVADELYENIILGGVAGVKRGRKRVPMWKQQARGGFADHADNRLDAREALWTLMCELTPNELHVLIQREQGKLQREVARHLGIGPQGVSHLEANIRRKAQQLRDQGKIVT